MELKSQIQALIAVGKRIRKGAASGMDKFASKLNLVFPLPIAVAEEDCRCGLL